MKIFIDLGAFDGDTLSIAKKLYPNFDYFYGFEPYLPNFNKLAEKFKNQPNILLFNQAVGTEDESVRLFLHKEIKKRTDAAEGNSLVSEKNNVSQENFNTVQSINFSNFILENFSDQDEIILKIDIEGKEYDLLEKMIEDGSIKKIKQIFCEWHQHKIPSLVARHDPLIKSLQNLGFVITGNNHDDEFASIASDKLKFLDRSFQQEKSYFFPYHWTVKPDSTGGRLYCGYLSICLEFLDKSSLRTETILDAGCGDGRLLGELWKLGAQHLYGVDHSAKAVSFARLLVPEATIEVSDLASTIFEDKQFESIFLIETLEHIPPETVDSVIKELSRILKDNGKLIISVPSTKRPAGGKHWQHFSEESLTKTLEKYFGIKMLYGQDKIGFHPLKLFYRLIDNKLYQIRPLSQYYNLKIWPRYFNRCLPKDGRRLISLCLKK